MGLSRRNRLLRAGYALSIFISVLLVVVGLGFIVMYVWEGVVARWGDPDQSLVFWYLPILFIGIFSFAGGVALFVVSLKKLRE